MNPTEISSTPRPSHRRNVLALIACAILLATFFTIGWSASITKSAAFDEPLHFIGAWIQTHYGDFRCNPEDPSLWKFYLAAGSRTDDLRIDRQSPLWDAMLVAVPAPAFNFSIASLYQTPGVDADALLRAARVRMLLLAVALGAIIAWWAWRLRGPLAAVIALAAFCLDPNFLAHAPLIKNDVPITLVFFALMAVTWRLGQRITLWRLTATSLLVAIALSTKFSGVLAFPMLAIALFCRLFIKEPWPVFHRILSSRWQRLAASLAIFLILLLVGFIGIWASYGFRYSAAPDPRRQFDFRSINMLCGVNEMLARHDPMPSHPSVPQLEQWVQDHWKPSLMVRTVNAASEHHLLPQTWLCGFLYTYATSLNRGSFLCGQLAIDGWWYYFPAAIAFKTPLATLVALAIAIYLLLVRYKNAMRNLWTTCALLVGPVFYFAVAMRSHLDIGLRHILPVYPFLFLFLGVTAAQSFSRRPKITGWAITLLLIGLATETLSAYPNFIPFFNTAVGGSRGGLALLSDSNIDWGQDLPALADWQSRHSDRQLYLCQFATPDPRYYKVHYIEMDGSQMSYPDQTIPSGLPPVYAISAVALQGTYLTPEQVEFYRRFENEKPFEVINGTIYLFNTPPP